MFAVVSKEIVKNVNTEKTHKMIDCGVYVFLFQRNVTKMQIRRAIEKKYAVKVDAVNTVIIPRKICNFRGSSGFSSVYKKAYVRLARDMKIDLVGSNSDR